MDLKTDSVKIFFFPFLGDGHQIPMIDTARVFAAHGAVSTILTTHSNALHFQKSITRDQQSLLPITIHILTTTPDITDHMVDTSFLLQPLKQFLLQHPPDCIVVDIFHGWASDIIDDLKIPRILFTGNGCFPHCVEENIKRHVLVENLSSDSEPFVVPGLPDNIEMTRSQLPIFMRSHIPDRLRHVEDKSFGTIVNSFYDLEPSYVDHVKNVFGKKGWLVGPVSLYNINVEDKIERGKNPTVDEQLCLNWLNSMKPNSVLYVSFGSFVRLPTEQLREIAYSLEASKQSFIWVVGEVLETSGGGENRLPDGFEERMKETNKGLIVRGWAPQLLILEHGAVGGFVTHCGWNSMLEAVCAGVPMITWPLTAEQFSNEKLITEVLRIGVQVGSREWWQWNTEWKEVVGRERVELAVKKLMVRSEEAQEMRRRVKHIARNARRAFHEGGTSYADTDALIQELKAKRLARQDNRKHNSQVL